MAQTILVCGGRDYGIPKRNTTTKEWIKTPEAAKAERDYLFDSLDKLAKELPIDHVVSGVATGADMIAHTWAADRKVRFTAFPADWIKHGGAAGPIRNALMLDKAKPDMVLAFPGGAGTADMVQKAQKAGVTVNQF